MPRIVTVMAIALGFALPQHAHTQQSRDRNLQTCLSGRYPALCDYSLLPPEQRHQAQAAELRKNLRVCLTGKYPALCNHSKLTPEEAKAVHDAERTENVRICSTGKYPALCRYDLLAPQELTKVRAAERAENLRICLDGRYPALCNHSLLSTEESKTVAAAEARVAAARPPRAVTPEAGPSRRGDCETGHWIESVEGNGKIIKLEDGSLWQVDDVDIVTTSIWLPISEVVVCDGKMINIDDDESVGVMALDSIDRSPPRTRRRGSGYLIEAAANDETFVVNGEVFKARTYCFGFERGDTVTFISGSPFEACATATVLNLRTSKTCELWCE